MRIKSPRTTVLSNEQSMLSIQKPTWIHVVADHFTQVLHCEHECVRDLATRPGRLSPMENYLPLHYDYLQFAYFRGRVLSLNCSKSICRCSEVLLHVKEANLPDFWHSDFKDCHTLTVHSEQTWRKKKNTPVRLHTHPQSCTYKHLQWPQRAADTLRHPVRSCCTILTLLLWYVSCVSLSLYEAGSSLIPEVRCVSKWESSFFFCWWWRKAV